MAKLTIDSLKIYFANFHISHFTNFFIAVLWGVEFDSVVYDRIKNYLRFIVLAFRF